ncbi:hypothetical protein PFLUV_G00088910 [Perca fluviatilis]|uniref:Uncharacterized protein n=1 Tax=Perca fluviatilis TaxID=8168 RepID=A0A6A5FF11_PERFL|nr:hypothetical protein PFLUV_G00088910 [Perca fluviatilis]
MASTPSTSALSAVLRCRGNIWTRNPPTKRPATSAYSLGLTGGSPVERTRSNQASAWEPSLQGDRALLEVLWRSSSSPDDALQHQNMKSNALQANGQIHSSTGITSSKDNSGSGQMIPENRPD